MEISDMGVRNGQSDSGVLLQIQGFSPNDGEGIRTTVFLPGCPLRCKWCANPETWTSLTKLAFYESGCAKCGRCGEVCHKEIIPCRDNPADSGCDLCGACVDACPNRALRFLCAEAEADDVIRRIERDEVFYRYSGGGVTYSGGEPVYQQAFLRRLVYGAEELGINQCIETCGYFHFEQAEDIFRRMDHIFLDIKVMDSEKHREYTGKSNELILQNAVKLHGLGVPMTIRIPAISGVNLTPENISATAGFVSENLPGADIELLPYHDLGNEKYRALRMEEYIYSFRTPCRAELRDAQALIQSFGVKITSYK